jgi:hypothetical protein
MDTGCAGAVLALGCGAVGGVCKSKEDGGPNTSSSMAVGAGRDDVSKTGDTSTTERSADGAPKSSSSTTTAAGREELAMLFTAPDDDLVGVIPERRDDGVPKPSSSSTCVSEARLRRGKTVFGDVVDGFRNGPDVLRRVDGAAPAILRTVCSREGDAYRSSSLSTRVDWADGFVGEEVRRELSPSRCDEPCANSFLDCSMAARSSESSAVVRDSSKTCSKSESSSSPRSSTSKSTRDDFVVGVWCWVIGRLGMFVYRRGARLSSASSAF